MKRRVKARNKFTILSVLMLITMLLVWGCGGNGDAEEPETEQPSQGEETPTAPYVEEPEQEEEQEEQEEQEGLSEEELSDLFVSGKDMDEFYYEMNISGMGEEESTTRFYIKGELIRVESEAMGQRFIMIYGEDSLFTLDPQLKTAIKMPLDMEDEEDRDAPTLDDFTNDVDENSMNYIGKETINGVSCHVVESRELNEDYQVKMWLHEEYGFPMRVESTLEDDELYISEVTDFQVGNVSDDLFEIPDDYEVVDLGSMIPTTP